MITQDKTNTVEISGNMIGTLSFSHYVKGEKFYKGYVEVKRFSGIFDTVPIIVSATLFNKLGGYLQDDYVHIKGDVRSHNYVDKIGTHTNLFILVKDMRILRTSIKDINSIFLDGYIVKPPTYRITPLDKEICDIILATNMNKKSAYIPCILWSRNARYVKDFEVGTHLNIMGRFQSRIYEKDMEMKTAYEVSVSLVKKEA